MSTNNYNHPKIELLCQGDAKTLDSLYVDFFSKFRRFVIKNSGTAQDAEEIFQRALYQLIARAKTKGVQINSSFESYFFVACRNLWYKELNKRKRDREVRKEGVIELKTEGHNDIGDVIDQERWELFDEMIKKLSSNCQELLEAYFSKVTYKEIVVKFGYANENTAFQRMFKCKKRLTELIKNDSRFTSLFTK